MSTSDAATPAATIRPNTKTSDRTTHYLARVDAHLSSLANKTARITFLKTEFSKWEERRAKFIKGVDSGKKSKRERERETEPPATIFDYDQTLHGLGALLSALGASPR